MIKPALSLPREVAEPQPGTFLTGLERRHHPPNNGGKEGKAMRWPVVPMTSSMQAVGLCFESPHSEHPSQRAARICFHSTSYCPRRKVSDHPEKSVNSGGSWKEKGTSSWEAAL